MKVLQFAVLLILINWFEVSAQQPTQIRLDVHQKPLNEVLLELKEKYNLQFAYDKDLLSNYQISVTRTFRSEQEALEFLLNDLPLALEKSGNVFLIFPESGQRQTAKKKQFTQISGQVMEVQTYEPLPFSYILINNKSIQSDRQGHFSFLASADTTFDLRISHLGYFIYDTLFSGGLNKEFLLTPKIEQISEVKVEGNPVERSTLIGDLPGKMKINHRIAPVLPGYGDNSVFNLLRLMPGIVAAGEQSNDLLIWGSYESHSRIQFDGFTVFGLKNFNDNISVVNPFVVKNIDVYKGGYGAKYRGRVEGIVDITGKNGSLQKPAFTFNINNTTVNSLLEIPVSENSSLMAAYRQTYYQLYDPTQLNLFRRNEDTGQQQGQGPGTGGTNGQGGMQTGEIDFTVQPDFNFRDANLKYSVNGDNGGEFYVSLYGGGDKFSYNMDAALTNNQLLRSESESNRQFGGAAFYSQPWQNGNRTSFTAGYSVFHREATEENRVVNTRHNRTRISKNIYSENEVDEFTFKLEHTLPVKDGNRFYFGAGIADNNVQFLRQSFGNDLIHLDNNSPRIFGYVQNDWPVTNFLDLKNGFRLVYFNKLGKVYTEPRIMATMHLTDKINFNASWGLYNQFLAKTSLVDSLYNVTYFWTNSDGESIPVLYGRHLVGGISCNNNGFTVSFEGYHKKTNGLTRFFNGTRFISRGFYQGEGRSYGLDVYLKKEYKRHLGWISYSWSKTDEHFPFFVRNYWRPAPHQQTHELKAAAIINLNRFYVSANYVYGSGFERFDFETADGNRLNREYSRLDAAVVYKFRPEKVKAEAGISVLNVFDTDNIKYSNLRRASVDEINFVGIYTKAVPFTPAVFFMLKF